MIKLASAAIFALAGMSASAQETVKIVFGAATDNSSVTLNKASFTANIASGAECIASVDYIERIFGAGPVNGVKFGSGKGGGDVAFTLTADSVIPVSQIIINGSKYAAKDDPTFGFWLNDADDEDAYLIEFTDTATDYVINLESTVYVENIELQSVGRAYLNSITFIGGIPADVTPTAVAAPTFSSERNRITVSADDATSIAYLVCYDGAPTGVTDLTEATDAVVVSGGTATFAIDCDATVLAQAFAPGVTPDLKYSNAVPSPVAVQAYRVVTVTEDVTDSWTRCTDIDDIEVGAQYFIAAPDAGMLLTSEPLSNNKGFVAASATFMNDDKYIVGADVAHAVTYTQSTVNASLHAFRFANDTYITASGDNVKCGDSITGSGNTSVSIDDDDYAVITFASNDKRMLLYHEGYDFRLNSKVNEHNPEYARIALYKHLQGGTMSYLEAIAIDGIEGDVNADGRVNIADVQRVLNTMSAAQPDASCDVNADGRVNIADAQRVLNIMAGN